MATPALAEVETRFAAGAFIRDAEIHAALGDPVRLQILYELGLCEVNVTGLCALLGKSQQAVSHHLTILKLRRMVELDRRGKSNFYRLTAAGRSALGRTSLV